MQPDNPGSIIVTVLAQPEPGAMLANITLTSKPTPVIADYKMDGKTVSGSFKLDNAPVRAGSIVFSAPVVPEPGVTADLKAKAAEGSPQVKSMRARAQAMVKGDLAAVARLSSPSEREELDAAVAQMGPHAKDMMRDAGRELLPALSTIERVVVRGEHAVVVFRNKESWQDMTLVDGEWKTGK